MFYSIPYATDLLSYINKHDLKFSHWSSMLIEFMCKLYDENKHNELHISQSWVSNPDSFYTRVVDLMTSTYSDVCTLNDATVVAIWKHSYVNIEQDEIKEFYETLQEQTGIDPIEEDFATMLEQA